MEVGKKPLNTYINHKKKRNRKNWREIWLILANVFEHYAFSFHFLALFALFFCFVSLGPVLKLHWDSYKKYTRNIREMKLYFSSVSPNICFLLPSLMPTAWAHYDSIVVCVDYFSSHTAKYNFITFIIKEKEKMKHNQKRWNLNAILPRWVNLQ